MTKSTPKKQPSKTAAKRKTLPPLKSAMVSSEAKAAAQRLAAIKAPLKTKTPKKKKNLSSARVKTPSKANRTSKKAVLAKKTAKVVSTTKPAKKVASPKAAISKTKTVKKVTAIKPKIKKSRLTKKVTATKKTVAAKPAATKVSKSTKKRVTAKTPPRKLAKAKSVAPRDPKKATTSKAKTVKRVATVKPKAKKARVTKKVTVAKKSVATKPVITKTIQSTKRRAIAKTATPKSAKTKTRTSHISKTPKIAVGDLNKTLTNLEVRMKRANTLTRKNVKALEASVAALDARTKKDGTLHKAALTRKVNQLSAKLTDMIAQTQSSVNSELKTALTNPSVEGLQAALSRADARLTQAETLQSAAISKINHHLSAIATTVEARLKEETSARKAALTELKQETHNRIDIVERDTATALSRAGDKIAELAAELQNRNDAMELSVREKVSEIALQTQAEFEQYRSRLETRIESIETNEAGDARRLEQSIASLTSRIEGLEYGLAALPVVNTEPVEVQAAPMPVPAIPTAPQLTLVEAPTLQAPEVPEYTAAPSALPDAFSPLASMPIEQTAPAPVNPYLAAEPETTPEPIVQESHIPVEFDPSQYQWSQQSGESGQALIKEQIQVTPPTEKLAPVLSAPATLDTMLPAADAELPPVPNTPPPVSETVPYADPAYAETNPTMATSRIGGETGRNVNMPALPKLTGRNLRVAALATGVAVLGLVTAKSILGEDPIQPPQLEAITTESPATADPISVANVPMVDPIGEYEDNKAVTVTGDAATTLNSAASAGEPIAQFQLGLSYLEQGRTDEGVTLIRKAANQSQPAAQYRLAKLYEIGEGVEQDAKIARQLTERAARNGNRIAMHDLALYYAEGRGGVTADLPTAAKWFEKAAERGVVDSQFNLGVLFESGQGLPKNVTDAFVWYSIAAGQGDQFAKTRIDVLKGALPETELAAAAGRVEVFTPVKIDDAANGIFHDVPWAKPSKTAAKNTSQVKQAQSLLGELGYDIGGADGAIGPRTREAIMSFERANSLPETGEVNTALIDLLEIAAGA